MGLIIRHLLGCVECMEPIAQRSGENTRHLLNCTESGAYDARCDDLRRVLASHGFPSLLALQPIP